VLTTPGLLSLNFCHVKHNIGCAWPGFQKKKKILSFNYSLSQKLHWKYNSHWAVWALTKLLCTVISYAFLWKRDLYHVSPLWRQGFKRDNQMYISSQVKSTLRKFSEGKDHDCDSFMSGASVLYKSWVSHLSEWTI